MTVQNQNVKNVYRGNGSATVFPFTFAINKEHPEYIHVYITDDGGKAVETTDFTCDMEAKTITYPKTTSSAAKLSSTQRLTIYRLLPYTQELNLVNQGPFFAEDVETELDDLEMQIQQQKEESGRSLQVGLEVESFDTTIPVAAGKTFRVKDDGTGFELTEDPAVAHAAAVAAQEAAERAQGAAETAQGKAEEAQEEAETAKDAAEIIATQIDIMARALIYNSVAAMKADTTLVAGMTAGTKGYNGVNDGNGASYTIRLAKEGETGDDQNTIMLDNGNVAEKIKSKSEILSSMIDEIDLNRSPWMLFRKFESYTATQGMCVAGNFLIETAYKNSETDGRLYVIDIDNKAVVDYIAGVQGHMNSLCYDADNKMVCVADSGGVIHRYSLSDAGDIAYVDDVTAPISTTGIGWNNGLFYLRNGSLVVVAKNITEEVKRFRIAEGMSNDDITRQGMDVDDHFSYMPYSGKDAVERLHIYDKEDGKLLKVLTYSRGTFGEFEECAIRNGYLFININRPFSGSMLGVFKIPLYKSTVNELDVAKAHYSYQQNSKTQDYYVDSTQDIAFPDGTQEHPYNTLSTAITLYNLNASAGLIRMVEGQEFDSIYIGDCKNIRIDFRNCKVSSRITIQHSVATLLNVNAKQLYIEQSFVNIVGGTIDWSYDGEISVNSPLVNYRSVITGSITLLKNCEVETVGGNNGLTAISILNFTDSDLKYTPVSNNNMVNINGTWYERWYSITANSNLDDINKIGRKYYCSAINAVTLTNCPTTINFLLKNFIRSNENAVIQQITTVQGETFTRQLGSTTWYRVQRIRTGTTENRPNGGPVGLQYFDTTINKPIWWNGTAWVDATGAVV